MDNNASSYQQSEPIWSMNNAAAFGPGISAVFDLPISKKASIQSGIGFYYLQNRVDYPVDSGSLTIHRLNGSSKSRILSETKKADLIFPFSISYRIWQEKKSQIRIAPGLLFGYYLVHRAAGDYYQPPNELDSLFQPGPFHYSDDQIKTRISESIFLCDSPCLLNTAISFQKI